VGAYPMPLEISLAKLITSLREGKIENLIEELRKAENIWFLTYRLPRIPIKVRNPRKELVELNPGVHSRLEYALFKASIEAAKNGKIPVFKDIAEITSDYKATAKYLAILSENNIVVFPDPVKASKLIEAIKALSESKYQRRIIKALDLPVVVNFKLLEERASKLNCKFKDTKIVCFYTTHNEERDQDKLQVNIFNEYISQYIK
jgi:hypothetical protein